MNYSKKNVNVYYLDGTFYVIGLVRMPPIGLRAEVLPLFTSLSNKPKELADAIESAKLGSDISYPPNQENLERKGWDGEKGKVWKHAEKSWDIFWEENGGVNVSLSEPKGEYEGETEWKGVPNSEKVFSLPVSTDDIVKVILSQL